MASTWQASSSVPLWWTDIQHSLDEAFDQYNYCLNKVEIYLNAHRGNNRDFTLALLNKELYYALQRLKSVLNLAKCRRMDALSAGMEVSMDEYLERLKWAMNSSSNLQTRLKTAMMNISGELNRLNKSRNTPPAYKETTPICIDLHL